MLSEDAEFAGKRGRRFCLGAAAAVQVRLRRRPRQSYGQSGQPDGGVAAASVAGDRTAAGRHSASPQARPARHAPNHRLILKDGTYQIVREYEIVGDRVRYLSEERADWEELPVDLVDWDATRKWEQDHAQDTGQVSPGMTEAEEVDKEETDARDEQRASASQLQWSLGLRSVAVPPQKYDKWGHWLK